MAKTKTSSVNVRLYPELKKVKIFLNYLRLSKCWLMMNRFRRTIATMPLSDIYLLRYACNDGLGSEL